MVELSNKECDIVRVKIGRKLSSLVNSKDGLWEITAALARTSEFTQIKNYEEKVLKELEVIEKEIGINKDIEEIRRLVAFSLQSKAQQVPSQAGV